MKVREFAVLYCLMILKKPYNKSLQLTGWTVTCLHTQTARRPGAGS